MQGICHEIECHAHSIHCKKSKHIENTFMCVGRTPCVSNRKRDSFNETPRDVFFLALALAFITQLLTSYPSFGFLLPDFVTIVRFKSISYETSIFYSVVD